MKDTDQLQKMVESAVQVRLNQWQLKKPENLYAPVCYALGAGGKRLRPLLVLLGYQLYGDHPEEALSAALAVEVFHNFTLLHDDIMDKAEIRRNQPTVHLRFSENSAILSGDVMAFMAYQLLLESPAAQMDEITALFTQTAVEICEGQQLDMDFEQRMTVTTGEYLEMIRLKTAVLLGCALKTGALLGGAGVKEAGILYDAGISLGLAFQLQDDFLDTFGDESAFGKKIGGDILSNKKTFLLTEALSTATGVAKEELTGWLTRANSPGDAKIQAVKALFEKLGIREAALEKITGYHEKAMHSLDLLRVDPLRMLPLKTQM